MRIKYYLRGIGIGIIFAVIVMSVAFGKKSQQQISDAEIIQRAKQLGMIDAESVVGEKETEADATIENKIESQENEGQSSEQVTEIEDTELDTDSDKGSVNSLANKVPKTEEKSKEKDSEDKNKGLEDKELVNPQKDTDHKENEKQDSLSNNGDNEKKQDEYVTITIKSGQVCRQIAEDLQKQGIIDDADAFREYMGRRGLASRIRCGTFKLPKGASYQKIADCLINK